MLRLGLISLDAANLDAWCMCVVGMDSYDDSIYSRMRGKEKLYLLSELKHARDQLAHPG